MCPLAIKVGLNVLRHLIEPKFLRLDGKRAGEQSGGFGVGKGNPHAVGHKMISKGLGSLTSRLMAEWCGQFSCDSKCMLAARLAPADWANNK